MATSKKKIHYTEFLNKRTSSAIWNSFLRADDGQTAKCKICNKVMKTAGGATTGLHTHLKAMHPTINITDTPSTSTGATPGSTDTSELSKDKESSTLPKKRRLITDFLKSSNSMEVVIARMAALDGASFRLFIESQDLRQLFKKSGHELPKSANTISKIILTQAENVKEDVKKKILELKSAEHRFALTLDEWTSMRNKRYMNINLHSKALGGSCFLNLGLVKITGSLTAFAAYKILEDHLAKFNVSLEEDIISQTTDGASVMVKMGTYFTGHHQLCLAHGIQLAVIDTLYKSTKEPEPIVSFSDPNTDNFESDEEENIEDGDFEIETPRAIAEPGDYKELVDKVRSVVRKIRKSPLKADALRAYVLKDHRQDIQLLLDFNTRWSSMSDMIGVFLNIKEAVFKVLIDFKLEISFTEADIQTLTVINCSLNLVKLTVLSLCRRDSTLYTADVTLKFMLRKLDENNSVLSSKLAMNLRRRIKERRIPLAGVLHYLHDSESFFKQEYDDTFYQPNNEEISEIIVGLLRRLKHDIPAYEPQVRHEHGESLSISSSECLVTVQEQLNRELEKCKPVERRNEDELLGFDLKAFVKVERAMFEQGGARGVYLTQVMEYITCVLPTSVESERVFSSAGYFCNKLRSSLSDKMLDALSILRTYFQDQRNFSKKN